MKYIKKNIDINIFFFILLNLVFFKSNLLDTYTSWNLSNLKYLTIQEQLNLVLDSYEKNNNNNFFFYNPFEFIVLSGLLDSLETSSLYKNYIGFSWIPHPYHFEPYRESIINNITPFSTKDDIKNLFFNLFKNLEKDNFFFLKNELIHFFNLFFIQVNSNFDLIQFHTISNLLILENDVINLNDLIFINNYTYHLDILKNTQNLETIIESCINLLNEFKTPANLKLLTDKEHYYNLLDKIINLLNYNDYNFIKYSLIDLNLIKFNLNYSFYQQHYIYNTICKKDIHELIDYLNQENNSKNFQDFKIQIFNLITSNDFFINLEQKKLLIELNSKEYDATFKLKRDFFINLKKNILNLPENSICKKEFKEWIKIYNNDKYFFLLETYYNLKLK